MLIKNLADLDQEILRLKELELPERTRLLSHIITPSAMIHTTAGLFKSWIKAGRHHKEEKSRFGILGLLLTFISPLKIFRVFISQSATLYDFIRSAATMIIAHFIQK